MNPYERQILNDAEEQVFQTQQEFDQASETSGIRPPPDIEETESVLEPQLFGMWFGGQPESEAFPASTSPIPPPPVCASQICVTFDSFTFPCGCQCPSGCAQVVDLGFNPSFFILPFLSHPCGANTCYWQLTTSVNIRENQYGGGTCTGIPSSSTNAAIHVVLISGVYYVLMAGSNSWYFAGSTSSIGTPASNELSCATVFDICTTSIKPLVQCISGCPSVATYVPVTGGTAALSFC